MTDYKKDVLAILDSQHEWMGREGDTDTTRIAEAIEANTLATLYLADQQRISNLIAYVAEWNQGRARGDYGSGDGAEQVLDAIGQINTGLGLA